MKNYNISVTVKEFNHLLANEINKHGSDLLNIMYKTAKNNPDLISEIESKKLPKIIDYYGKVNESNWIEFLLANREFEWLNLFLENNAVKNAIIESIQLSVKNGSKNLITTPEHALFNKNNGLDYLFKNQITFINDRHKSKSSYDEIYKSVFLHVADIFLENVKIDSLLIKQFLNSSVEKEYKIYKKRKLIQAPIYFEYLNLFENKTDELRNINMINWNLKNSENQNILYLILNYNTDLIDLIMENIPEEEWHIKDSTNRSPLEHLLTRNWDNEVNINRVNYILNKKQINLTAIDIKRLVRKTIDLYSDDSSDNLKIQLINIFQTLINNPLINEPIAKETLKSLTIREDVKDLNAVFLKNTLQKSLPENNIKRMKNKL